MDSRKRYWGTLTSLYDSLSAQQTIDLEKAIECRYRGLYKQAESIYSDLLPPSRSIPVVAIERATLYERMGYETKRAEILREALETVTDNDDALTHSVRCLLRILLASSDLYVLGQLKASLEEARILRAWLILEDPLNYSDVMVWYTNAQSNLQAL